jgi:hypothetical protein
MVTRSAFILLFLAGTFSAASAALANDVKLLISEQDCRWLVIHVADDSISYKPGVDVRGKPVMPADLPDNSKLDLQDQLLLNLDIPLRTFLGRRQAGRLASAEVNVGQVSIDTDSRDVYYNGQPVSDAGRRDLIDACRGMAGKRH